MSSSPIPAIIETIVRFECPKCGNNCQCGVPYVPKMMRAAEAIKANPRSRTGLSLPRLVPTRRRCARPEATADQSAVQERIGLDGKTRKVPSKEPEPEPPAPTSPCPCPLRDDEPHIRLSKTWLAVAGEPIAADADEQEADIGDKEKPDRIITKAELMPLLKSILKYYKQNDDWCEFPDADIELFDTLVEAEEVLHFLVWEARRNDTLKKR